MVNAQYQVFDPYPMFARPINPRLNGGYHARFKGHINIGRANILRSFVYVKEKANTVACAMTKVNGMFPQRFSANRIDLIPLRTLRKN
ncbi:hypothetical protein D3C85_1414100 [compost metagenome]